MQQLRTTINSDLSNINQVIAPLDLQKVKALVEYFESKDGLTYLSEFHAYEFKYFYISSDASSILDPFNEGNIVDSATNILTDSEGELFTVFQEVNSRRELDVYFLPKQTTTDVFRSFVDNYLQNDEDKDGDDYIPPYKVAGMHLN